MRNTKTKLISSVTVLLICFAMLIGSTFAWFTDSASTGVNKIQAGNLDVQLFAYTNGNYKDVNENADAPLSLFGKGENANQNNESTLWEPGKTQVAYLKIKNNGNLDLKYKVEVEVVNPAESKDLYKVMKYEIIPNATPSSSVTSWSGNGTRVLVGNNSTQAVDVQLAKGSEHYFALAVHMDEDAGNTYQNGKVEFYIHVYATQLNSESDSFGHDYDVNAQYQMQLNARVDVENGQVKNDVTVTSAEKVAGTNNPVATVTIPVGVKVKDGVSTITTTVEPTTTPSNTSVAVTSDSQTFEVKADGIATGENGNNIPLTITAYIGKNLDNVKLYHNGDTMTENNTTPLGDQQYSYDRDSGYVTFASSTFSPFTAIYDKESWAKHAVSVTPVENVIDIKTEEELAGLSDYFNSNTIDCDLTVNITKNIDLSKYIWSSTVLTIGSAKTVTINGNGNTISGLTTSSTVNSSGFPCNGLISGINSVVHSTDSLGTLVVTNLNVNGANISSNTAQSCSAVIVGNVSNAKFIAKDCTVTDSVVNSGSYSAGIVGYVQKNVDGLIVNLNNCKVLNSTIKGKHAAALVAYSNGEINISGGKINRNTLSSLKHSASALVGSAVKDVTATGVSVEENAYYREGSATCDIYNQKYGYIHIFENANYTVDGSDVTAD